MKCCIRRYDEEKEEFKDSYFDKHLWGNQNHWVILRQDAKIFNSVAEANFFIKMYKLKNVKIFKLRKGDLKCTK